MIRTGYKNEKEETIVHYMFLDHQFQPYYGPQHSTWKYNTAQNKTNAARNKPLILLQRLDKLQFMAFSPPVSSGWKREKVWVPVFVQETYLPEADQNSSMVAVKGPEAYVSYQLSHSPYIIRGSGGRQPEGI